MLANDAAVRILLPCFGVLGERLNVQKVQDSTQSMQGYSCSNRGISLTRCYFASKRRTRTCSLPR